MDMNKIPTVLVADDEEPMRMFLVGLLEHEQCEVIGVCSNGEEALQLYQQHKPDITLLDINSLVQYEMALKRGRHSNVKRP